MDGIALTSIAERAGSRYQLFLTALSAVYYEASLSPRVGTQSNKNTAAKKAYTLASNFISDEQQTIRQEMLDQADVAYSYIADIIDGTVFESMPQQILNHVSSISQTLEHAVRTQLERDVSQVASALSHTAMRANVVSQARNVSYDKALASVRSDGPTTGLFKFQDRAGRSIPSQKFIRTIWRQSLVTAWNETALLAMASAGITEASIEHPDDTYKELGTVIDLTERGISVSWDDVKEELFHPNSHAYLTPVL